MYDMNVYSKELLKGTLTTIILKLLIHNKTMYGNEIVQRVKLLSDERILLKEGSLYLALHKLKDAVIKIQTASFSVILITVVCALFAFNNKRPSTASMKSLLEVNETMERSFDLKMKRVLSINNIMEPDFIQTVNEMNQFIERLKVYVVKSVDDRSVDGKMDLSNVSLMNNISSYSLISENCPTDLKGDLLQSQIEKFLAQLQKHNVQENTILTKMDSGKTWVETHFKGKSMYGVYTTLNNFQLEIADLELVALSNLPSTPS